MTLLASAIVSAGSDDAGVGTITWIDPGNITGSDNTWAVATLAASEVSHYAKGLFSTPLPVPVGSRIDGIVLAIQKNRQSGIGTIRDSVVKLVKAGSVVGDNKADTLTDWNSSVDSEVTYGGVTDLWGTTWTLAEVTATDFGAVISASNGAIGLTDNARVDVMRVDIYGEVVSAALTGTALVDPMREPDIVTGGKTIIITLTGDTWVASGATFDAQRQNIIDGIDAATSPTNGWNNEVRDKEVVTAVVRTSDTVVTITLTASAAYNISAQEDIGLVIPATALTGGVAPNVTYTFRVVPDVTGPLLHLGGLGIGKRSPLRKMATARRAIVPAHGCSEGNYERRTFYRRGPTFTRITC